MIDLENGLDQFRVVTSNSVIRALSFNNCYTGIHIYAPGGGNVVEACYIGAGIDGNTGGTVTGNSIFIDGSSNNRIGGTASTQWNVISSANSTFSAAIAITGPGATGNVIQGNSIGVGVGGTNQLKGAGPGYGISLMNASSNLLGGALPGAGNVIGYSYVGLIVDTGSGNLIQGNHIGVDRTGMIAIPNLFDGIDLKSGGTNAVGGDVQGAGNLISGNTQFGVSIQGPAGAIIQGNFIGTDITGTSPIPNGHLVSLGGLKTYSGGGIWSSGGNYIYIGGLSRETRNLLAGNWGPGINIQTTLNVGDYDIRGNFIGLDVTGTFAIGNSGDGLIAPPGATIGGPDPAMRNVISGNVGNGLSLFDIRTWVQGNYIGTDATGTNAVPNQQNGIAVYSSGQVGPGTMIGGTNANEGNVISANLKSGITLGDTNNPIQGIAICGNWIWTAAGSQNPLAAIPLPNANYGVEVYGAAASPSGGNPQLNKIGGIGAAAQNIFGVGAAGRGVVVYSGMGTYNGGNTFVCAQCSPDEYWDIGDDGPGQNDPGDTDTAPNNRQNHPVISGITINGSTALIHATLNSKTNATFQITFYGKMGTFSGLVYGPIGSTNVQTDLNGNAQIDFEVDTQLGIDPATIICQAEAVATGDTSEFSQTVPTNPPGRNIISFTQTIFEAEEGETQAVITVHVDRSHGQQVTTTVRYRSSELSDGAGAVAFVFGGLSLAITNIDFSSVDDMLVFDPNETDKQIIVPVNHHLNYRDEVFGIELYNSSADAVIAFPICLVRLDQPDGPFLPLMIARIVPPANAPEGVLNFSVTFDPRSYLLCSSTVTGPWETKVGVISPLLITVTNTVTNTSGFFEVVTNVLAGTLRMTNGVAYYVSNSLIVAVGNSGPFSATSTNGTVALTNVPAGSVPLVFSKLIALTDNNTGERKVVAVSITWDVVLIAGATLQVPVKIDMSPSGELPPLPCACVPWCGIMGGVVNGVQTVVASGGKLGTCVEDVQVTITGPGGISVTNSGQRQKFSPAADGTWTVTSTICSVTKTCTITLP